MFGEVATVQAETRLFYAPASEIGAASVHWKSVFQLADNIVKGYAVNGSYIYAITHSNAPRYKVVRTKLADPDWAHAETVFPEAADSLNSITKTKNFLFANFSNGIVCRLQKYDFSTGKVTDVKLPASGTVDISCPDFKSDLCHVVITSWTLPATRYDYDPQEETFTKSTFNSDVHYPGFEDLVSEEVEAPSHDGVMVPLSIIHKKGIPLDGSNCCILDGYGAYGESYDRISA